MAARGKSINLFLKLEQYQQILTIFILQQIIQLKGQNISIFQSKKVLILLQTCHLIF